MFPRGSRFVEKEPENTPGPTAYSVKTGLVHDDPNKHFGFLQKSKRFREPTAESAQAENEENVQPDTNKSVVNQQNIKTRKEVDESFKLKKEVDRLKEIIEKQSLHQQKEVHTLEDKISKLDSHLQLALKEKNALQSSNTVKDKEIADLLHKQNVLRANLEKTEKISMSYQDKLVKSATLEKKAVSLEKKNSRMKDVVEKRLTVEERLHRQNEEYQAQVKELSDKVKSLDSNLMTEKETLARLKQELSISKSEHDNIVTSVQLAAEKRMQDTITKNAELEKCVESLNEQMESMKSDHQRLTSQLKERLTRADHHTTTLMTAMNEIKSIFNQSSMSLEEITDGQLELSVKFIQHAWSQSVTRETCLQQDRDLLEAQVQELNQSKADLESKIHQLESHIQQSEQALQEKSMDWQSRVQERDDKIRHLEHVAGLASDSIQTLKQNLSDLEQRMAHERNELTLRLEQHHTDLAAKDKQISDLESSLADTLASKRRLESVCQVIESEKQASQKELELLQSTMTTEQVNSEQAQRVLKSEMETLKMQLAELTACLANKDEELASKESTVSTLSNKLTSAETMMQEQMDQLSVQCQSIQALEIQVQELTLSKKSLEMALGDKEASLGSSAEHISDLTAKLETAHSSMNDLTRTLEANTLSLTEKMEELDLLKSVFEELKVKHQAIESSLQESQSMLQQQSRVIEIRDTQLQDQRILTQELQSQYDQLLLDSGDRSRLLEATVARLTEQVEMKECDMVTQVDQLNNLLSREQEIRKNLEEVIEKERSKYALLCEEKIQEQGQHELKVSGLVAQHQATQDALQAEKTKLQDQLKQEALQFNNVIQTLNDVVAEKTREIELINSQLASKLNEFEVMSKDLKSQLQVERNQYQEQLALEQSRLCTALKEHDETQKRLTEEIVVLKSEVEAFKKFAGTKEQQVENLKQAMTALQAESRAKEEATLAQLEQVIAAKIKAEEQCSSLCKEVNDLLRQKQTMQCEIEDKVVQMQSLENLLEQIKAELEHCKQENASLCSDKKFLAEQIHEHQVNIEKAEANLVNLDRQLQSVTLERDEADKNIVALEGKVKEFVGQLNVERENNHRTILDYQKKYTEITVLMKEAIERAEKAEQERHAVTEKLKFIQLSHSNEIGSKDIRIKSLEDQLKEKAKLLEVRAAEFVHTEKARAEHAEMCKEVEWARERVRESEEKTMAIQSAWANEKYALEAELERKKMDLKGYAVEIEKLRQKSIESEGEFQRRLDEAMIEIKKVKAKEQVATLELKKLSDEQCDVLGHHNSKQKIRHVAQLKEENINLKKEMMAAKLQKDEYKRKLLAVERELEAYKAVGGKAPMSRVQRTIRQTFSGKDTSDSLEDLKELCIDDKENSNFSKDLTRIV